MLLENITPEELIVRRVQGALLVDVRDPDEFAISRIPGSVNLPLAQLEDELVKLSGLTVFVCVGGYRSTVACHRAQQLGKFDVANLSGGTIAWSQHGYVLERGRRENP
jgi:rhodanese-related sulfurtransferase